MDTNPQTLQAVKDFANKYPDPLAGESLDGKGEIELKKLFPSANTLKFQGEDYLVLSAAGDGNCFLNSFSVLLTGQSLTLALPLRTKLCLELMTKPEEWFDAGSVGDEKKDIEILKKRLIKDDKLALNREWLDNTHIEYMCRILKRPVTVITTDEFESNGQLVALECPGNFLGGNGIKFKYSQPFFIYRKGGHFQPLLKI